LSAVVCVYFILFLQAVSPTFLLQRQGREVNILVHASELSFDSGLPVRICSIAYSIVYWKNEAL